jgi:hypothetical protein
MAEVSVGTRSPNWRCDALLSMLAWPMPLKSFAGEVSDSVESAREALAGALKVYYAAEELAKTPSTRTSSRLRRDYGT